MSIREIGNHSLNYFFRPFGFAFIRVNPRLISN